MCPKGCRKHLTIDESDEDEVPDFGPRLRMLSRLESMVHVGCKFAPNDLGPDQWRDLIILAEERAYVDGVVDKKREEVRKEIDAMEKAQAAARQQAGIPPPGQSAFPRKR